MRDRTAVRNRVAAVLSRHLVRAPMTDVFGVRGRAWLAALELPPDERLALDAAVRIDAVLCEQVAAAERAIAEAVVDDPRARRLLTIPGIGLVTGASILAVVGDIDRFDRPAKLVSYLGLDPRVRQSGDRPAIRGHISRAGQAHARGLLCEAAHSAVRSPGPLAGLPRPAQGAAGCRRRDRRDSPQARGARVAPAHQGRGLPVRARRHARPSSTGHSTAWRDGQGRGRRNGERLVRATTRVGQGCAAGMIPMTPPFATRSTASSRTIHRRPGLDTFIRRCRTRRAGRLRHAMPRLLPHDVMFFASAAGLRAWLELNHPSAADLWIGVRSKASGLQTLAWTDAVDELLCFGWIDGVSMPYEGARAIRATPRRTASIWSDRNVGRVEALRAEGRMTPAGEAAFALRRGDRTGVYSFEREWALDEGAESALRADPTGFSFWEAQPQSYRRAASHWVMSAKRPDTRARRLDRLVAGCAARERLVEITGRARTRDGSG